MYHLRRCAEGEEKWKDVVTAREAQGRQRLRLHLIDARKPSQPQPLERIDGNAVAAASIFASLHALEAASCGRLYGLPFVQDMEHAPILGQGKEDTSLTIRSSSGGMLLQRFTSPSHRPAQSLKKDLAAGKPALEARFQARPPAKIRHGAASLHCGPTRLDCRSWRPSTRLGQGVPLALRRITPPRRATRLSSRG